MISRNQKFLAAVYKGDVRILERVLSLRRIDINCYGRIGYSGSYHTALHVASGRGQLDVMNLLLDNGADINILEQEYGDNTAKTPLYWATCSGQYDAVRLLIDRGATLDIIRGTGCKTPLTEACREKHFDIAILLIEHDAKVTFDEEHFETPLYWSCFHGNYALSELLLKKGSDIYAKGIYNETPLSLAQQYGRDDIVTLFKTYLWTKKYAWIRSYKSWKKQNKRKQFRI